MAATETIEFRVIGEQRDDCGRLLLLGSDGQMYDYTICRDELVLIEPDETWRFDPVQAEGAESHPPSSGPSQP
jgi:hypothetical protein